jgi:hypothetical protein
MAPIIDKFTKWTATQPAWVANTFHRLIAEGRSPARAKKLTVLVERATGSEFILVPGTKRAKWFLPNAPGAPEISRYVRELKLHGGISPMRLAAERTLAASQGQEPLNGYLKNTGIRVWNFSTREPSPARIGHVTAVWGRFARCLAKMQNMVKRSPKNIWTMREQTCNAHGNCS